MYSIAMIAMHVQPCLNHCRETAVPVCYRDCSDQWSSNRSQDAGGNNVRVHMEGVVWNQLILQGDLSTSSEKANYL